MTNPRAALLLTVLLGLLPAAPGAAFDRPGGAETDPVRRLVFGPEMVIRHQHRIGLSPEQREQLTREMQATQAELVPLRIELSAAGERLAELLRAPRVDEQSALALTGEMLALEARIKSRHMALLVRIKNLLSEDQQRALLRIRRQVRAAQRR